jgi:predicted metal-dependent hydrolase
MSRGPRDATVLQGDRRKAYRPLTDAERRAAFEEALRAWAHGDFFETHECLEPAWMGTDVLAERALHQGIIKLAAGYVHAVRGNPAGMAKNLEGARVHLAGAGSAATAYDVDTDALIAAIDAKLIALAAGALEPALVPPPIRRIAPA